MTQDTAQDSVWRPRVYPVPGYSVERLYLMLARELLRIPGWRGVCEPVVIDAAADKETYVAHPSR